MPIDWEGKVGAPTVAVFGDPALYVPASEAPAFDVVGVFDDQFRGTVIVTDGDPHTSDSLPVFGVNSRQFLPTDGDPGRAMPVQNDKIVFPAGTKWFSGKSYLVTEPRPDGHGVFHLALNEAAA